MAYQFDTENAITSGNGDVWLYGLKALLVSVGWTVSLSGNGSSAGAADYISSSTDLAQSNSWMVLKKPDGEAEWCFSKVSSSGTANWDILYSKEALFTGGSTTDRATATDEQYIQGRATALFMTGNTTWNAVADDAYPYGWVLFGWDTGGTTNAGIVLYDPMATGTCYPDDPDPYICATINQYENYRIPEIGDVVSNNKPKGWTGATWGAIPGSKLADANGTNFANGCGGNPYSGNLEDPIVPIPYFRNDGQTGTTGWKGFGTMAKWVGSTRAVKSTLTTGTSSYIVFGLNAELCFPWPFQG